jgi:putative hydrolase of the HAD superfamily
VPDADRRFEAVWLDAGGVLVLPDPTVLAPLLGYYGGSLDIDRHRRAHYAAMAVKSAQGADERDWFAYDRAYVASVGVADRDVDEAARLLGETRHAPLWRWPIPESVAALRALAAAGVPLGVVSNASGQIAAVLARSAVCQVGAGPGVDVRCVIDSHLVGVAKPDPAIFDHAAPFFAGLERPRIAYVGDSVTMDVGGAVAAGLHPILLDPYDDHDGAPFERIRALDELVAGRAQPLRPPPSRSPRMSPSPPPPRTSPPSEP